MRWHFSILKYDMCKRQEVEAVRKFFHPLVPGVRNNIDIEFITATPGAEHCGFGPDSIMITPLFGM